MESAIPLELMCPRIRARRIGDDFEPPYPAWTARSSTGGAATVMAYMGVQFSDESGRGAALDALRQLDGLLDASSGCAYRDYATYRDEAGYDNLLAIAYWINEASHRAWTESAAVVAWWQQKLENPGKLGYFREVLSPTSDRFETLFSSPDQMEGVGLALGKRSAEDIQEHAYWGSMRDRLPCSQTDALENDGTLVRGAGPSGSVIRVNGHENLALIRSGQDWTDTKGKERELYLDGIEPIFREGMDFLRDEGTTIGCYANRYLTCIDLDGTPMEKSFGMSFWRSLGDMEAWAEHHPTHLRIFGTFMQTVQELEFQLDLRLYHEVSVMRADQQFYEYINCHDRTGVLNGLQQRADPA